MKNQIQLTVFINMTKENETADIKVIHTTDAVSQLSELLRVVQYFNTLCVGVVAHRERSWDSGCKFSVEKLILGKFSMQSKLYVHILSKKRGKNAFSYLTFSLASSKLSATK